MYDTVFCYSILRYIAKVDLRAKNVNYIKNREVC